MTLRGMARNILDANPDTCYLLILGERLSKTRFLETTRHNIQMAELVESFGFEDWLDGAALPHEDTCDTLDRLFKEVREVLPVKLDYVYNRETPKN